MYQISRYRCVQCGYLFVAVGYSRWKASVPTAQCPPVYSIINDIVHRRT